MELKDFIGKIVIGTQSKRRYMLFEIASPYIEVVSEHPNQSGHYEHYRFKTINGNPISNQVLVFEDATLTEPFKIAYNAYCRSTEAYWEEYGYWMRRD